MKKLFPLLLIFLFSSCCFFNRKISISKCALTENSLVVTLELSHFKLNNIGSVLIENSDVDRLQFESEGLKLTNNKNELIVSMDLTGKSIKSNVSYKMDIRFSGGYVKTFVIFKNKNSKEEVYTFPCDFYKECDAKIYDNSFMIGI